MSAFDRLFTHPLDVLLGVPLPEPIETSFVMHYTELCNARCAHCVVEAGPSRRSRADAAAARVAIEGAREAGVRHVVLTGGESFIYLEPVLELCRFARELGMRTRVISNAFWARSPECAGEMLERVARDGIDQLVISFDEYHLPYVKPDRVHNVFLGARLAETTPYLVFSTVVAEPGAVRTVDGVPWPAGVLDVLRSYGFDLGDCVPRDLVRAQAALLEPDPAEAFRRAVLRERAIVNWSALAYAGRAARELAAPGLPDQIGGGPCPVAGRQVTMTSEGRLYPCCSVWSTFDDHAFGTVSAAEDGFGGRVERMFDDPLVRVIREQGPATLVDHLERNGTPVGVQVDDACHMCERMLGTLQLDELRVTACELEVDQWLGAG
jgi:Radical SAM superfamily